MGSPAPKTILAPVLKPRPFATYGPAPTLLGVIDWRTGGGRTRRENARFAVWAAASVTCTVNLNVPICEGPGNPALGRSLPAPVISIPTVARSVSSEPGGVACDHA